MENNSRAKTCDRNKLLQIHYTNHNLAWTCASPFSMMEVLFNMDVLNQAPQLIITLIVPINFYLKRHVFEPKTWFTFCHVFRMSKTYKIRQNDFDAIFLQDIVERSFPNYLPKFWNLHHTCLFENFFFFSKIPTLKTASATKW